MPTYEYQCPDGHRFERFQRMSEEPKADCPVCGKSAQRLLSAGAGFIFKGSGFYATDYRSEQYEKSASAEESEASVASAATSVKKEPATAGSTVKGSSSGTKSGSGTDT
jgi:putative FmdB family regulatory protein